ncbi:magnesium-translocating P-type ATPase [Prescottella agglutinans]|uniref:Magnesium-transporting ATPase, P-type 1 n=1 Tax=Prescottella agglutinans TaxID=1644129 RepID=A0ABT6MAF4_9NOCA|nr:magnesium-translocating P-type ATPase [Prescottella agglutinans]MDH6281291.1 Mg2+-importing ATPase [Prescottella agglutinans]
MSLPSVAPPATNPKKPGARKTTAVLTDGQTETLTRFARLKTPGVLAELRTTNQGLREDQIEPLRRTYGLNEVRHDRPAPALLQLLATFKNPFILILLFIGSIMYVTDVYLADPEEGPDYKGVITVALMVTVSVGLRFWQEYRSSRAAEALKAMVSTTAATTRQHNDTTVTTELSIDQLLPGDVVQLAAGDMIPGDVRIIRAKDLQVNQAMLTGESMPAEKTGEPVFDLDPAQVLDAANLGFMGTSVVSGSATAVVVNTGRSTYFGAMTAGLADKRPETSFDIGVRKVSFMLIRFMLVMVPAVFIINGLTKSWTEALLFGVATAVGLTPEMLPLVVTANLAKGAMSMSRHKVIIKQLNSIQNFGAMDVLCTDKTGTLTEDRIVLEEHLDTEGHLSERTLRLAAMNSHFQTGLRNMLDKAVLAAAGDEMLDGIRSQHGLVDEVPFDFKRRRMSVVVDNGSTDLIITKGAVEEVLSVCSSAVVDGSVRAITPGLLAEFDRLVAIYNGQGKRVLAVATRDLPIDDTTSAREYSTADETGMTLVGFLTFLDPPKQSAAPAIAALQAHGTEVKVITGDNPIVAETVCGKVGIDVGTVVTGPEIEVLDAAALDQVVRETSVFAKVNPMQKARIVEALRRDGRTVGFLGDGVNDAPALRAADVGISVDTAVDIARESADIILLEKDLGVLENGVIEGRRTFGNIMKYIKMTASSNFGNMFSVLVASALLPFLPMIPAVILMQNLVYDLSMLTIPWDRVDREFLDKPQKWATDSLAKFMIFIGPISSIFDISTFALMWYVFGANSPEHAALFQSGWFIESLLSQTLIVHMIRTQRIPFIQSRASLPVLLSTGAACIFGLIFPFIGWGQSLGLVPLPWTYFPWLVLTLAAYCLLAQGAKVLFIRRFKVWL